MSTVTDAEVEAAHTLLRRACAWSISWDTVRYALEAAAAARPVPQAGEVAMTDLAGIAHTIAHDDDWWTNDRGTPILGLLEKKILNVITAQAAEIERLNRAWKTTFDRAIELQDKAEAQTAAIVAKDAEIAMWRGRALQFADERDNADRVIEDTAAELGCEPDNEAILVAIDALKSSISAKDAEISYLLDDYTHWIDAKIARDKARAVLAPAGKEPEQP